ncbi:MAG: hypothetical protein WAN20_20105 [Pseudonocardiaceae bacterium]|jgi:hypothetical protein|nr:hypothetical protein [Pseudonocardiaceae bacterium]
MRVSAIFAQGGGHHGHGGDCGCDYGCDDYFRYRGDYYYNGYKNDHYHYDYDRGDNGLLDIL